jgi:hypothetical protein
MTIWLILRYFGKHFPLWLYVPRKIWQSCMTAGFGSSKDVHGFA